jgi:putative ABC transport system permease protein
LVSGRTFTDSDVSGAPVAIISAATARRFWPGENAVGKHIRLLDDTSWRTVVGVVGDVRAYDLQTDIPNWMKGTAYVPYNASATLEDRRVPAEMTIVVRTTADESQAGTMVREAARRLNREIPVSAVKTMNAVVSEAAASPRSTATLFLVFAGLAVMLGVIGIYGVLSFLVANRTREIGIRMALGAQRGQVLWAVLKEGGRFSLAGIGLGIVGALLLMRVIASQLYGVSPTDPATIGAATIVFGVVAFLACYIPARRATHVDPMIALRYE